MTKEEIGELLKNARISLGLTTSEVIDMLNGFGFEISEKTLYSYEVGNSAPKISMFIKLCEIYGIDINSTFGFDKQKKPATEGDGLDERLNVFMSLSPEGQKQALDYMKFLADKEASNK